MTLAFRRVNGLPQRRNRYQTWSSKGCKAPTVSFYNALSVVIPIDDTEKFKINKGVRCK